MTERLVVVGNGMAGSRVVLDVLARDPDIPLTALPTDLVGELLERLVTGVPSVAHRRALEVSAVARTTSEGLLLDVRDVRLAAVGPDLVGLVGVADDRGDGVAAVGEDPGGEECDLAVAAEEDDVAHAADATRAGSVPAVREDPRSARGARAYGRT